LMGYHAHGLVDLYDSYTGSRFESPEPARGGHAERAATSHDSSHDY
jgi:hypothetical protein